MDRYRKLGLNILVDMRNKGISRNELTEQLGYSERKFEKLLNGNLFITKKEIEDISHHLYETYDELIRDRNLDEYDDIWSYYSLVHNSPNIDYILDMIDMYVELKERVSEIWLKKMWK